MANRRPLVLVAGEMQSLQSGDVLAVTTRDTVTATSSSLANNAVDSTTTIPAGKASLILKVQTSAAAWVRIYSDASSRTADLSRLITSDPSSTSGCLLDFATVAGTLSFPLAPTVAVDNLEGSVTGDLPMTVQNLSGGTVTITVTLTRVLLENT